MTLWAVYIVNRGKPSGAFVWKGGLWEAFTKGVIHFWIQYYRNGKPYRETTKSKKEADAKRLLKKREGEISEGKLPGIYFDRVKFDELAEDFLKGLPYQSKEVS